jgi:hypothetical protein
MQRGGDFFLVQHFRKRGARIFFSKKNEGFLLSKSCFWIVKQQGIPCRSLQTPMAALATEIKPEITHEKVFQVDRHHHWSVVSALAHCSFFI